MIDTFEEIDSRSLRQWVFEALGEIVLEVVLMIVLAVWSTEERSERDLS